MNCQNCGAEVKEEQKFCSVCGTKVEECVPKQPILAEGESQEPPVKTEKKKNEVMKVFISLLICILLVIVSVTTLSLLTVRDTFNESNVEKIVDKVDVKELLKTGIVDMRTAFDGNFTEKEIANIYEESSFKSYFKDVAVDLASYVQGKGDFPELDGEEIADLVLENEEIIRENSDYKLVDDAHKKIEDMVEDDRDFKKAVSKTEDVSKLVKFAVSIVWVVLLGIIIVLLMVWMFKVRQWSISALCWGGVSLCVSSAIFAIGVICTPIALRAEEDIPRYISYISVTVLKGAVWPAVKFGFIWLITGVVLIAAYKVTKTIKKRRAN